MTASAENNLPILELHITSFGPFSGVPENPSEHVMRAVLALLKECTSLHALDFNIHVASADVLEVSPEGVNAYVHQHQHQQKQRAEAAEGSDVGRNQKRFHFYLHLGVGRKGAVRCEFKGFNEIHVPWQRPITRRAIEEQGSNSDEKLTEDTVFEVVCVPPHPIQLAPFHQEPDHHHTNGKGSFYIDTVTTTDPNIYCRVTDGHFAPSVSEDDPLKMKLRQLFYTPMLTRPQLVNAGTECPSTTNNSVSLIKTETALAPLFATGMKNIAHIEDASALLYGSDSTQTTTLSPVEGCKKYHAISKLAEWGEIAPLAPSYDAGRYLCNYCLYSSCAALSASHGLAQLVTGSDSGEQKRRKVKNTSSLFVHVTPKQMIENLFKEGCFSVQSEAAAILQVILQVAAVVFGTV